VTDALAVASTWADETKAQTQTGDWHYIDLTLEDTRGDIATRCPHENCAPARIHIFAAELRSHQPSQRWSELDELRYLVHLVGDLHQPLHAATDADQGGNCEQLIPPRDNSKNLHALWDGGIIQEMNTDAKPLAADLEREIQAMPSSDREQIAAGTINEWTWQSHELAVHDIYGRLHVPVEPARFPHSCAEAPAEIRDFHPEIDGLYINDMKPVVRLQLIRAGLRLARLLNESM
jgi:hypothetical protein